MTENYHVVTGLISEYGSVIISNYAYAALLTNIRDLSLSVIWLAGSLWGWGDGGRGRYLCSSGGGDALRWSAAATPRGSADLGPKNKDTNES